MIRGLRVFTEMISQCEHDVVVRAIDLKFGKRRYERDHWDGVITNFRETEFQASFPCFERIEELLQSLGAGKLQTPHALDLAPNGHIDPHIDSVKFSGSTVAVLSLVNAATLRLGPSELRVEPRSLYVLQDEARYDHEHAILPEGRRLSLIFRDEVASER
ncbi:hypothetical protein CTAYLR_005200 [Chrysophaeum taylorii]|uniref:Uncharacterized protein n=1 Tax=Chrysophaeum taylorii TaxID=2483200 RepID=A0AAD7UH59_9STRA|nr:hypothetical protein CTAYLR_005183 [Chrysophaeum taylorii]KAJ8614165.1 hypothetical protein CTAYLR_005200 [Chrysophaeum taylorii]